MRCFGWWTVGWGTWAFGTSAEVGGHGRVSLWRFPHMRCQLSANARTQVCGAVRASPAVFRMPHSASDRQPVPQTFGLVARRACLRPDIALCAGGPVRGHACDEGPWTLSTLGCLTERCGASGIPASIMIPLTICQTGTRLRGQIGVAARLRKF